MQDSPDREHSEAARIDECLDTACALAECLRTERCAIQDNDLDTLTEISERKQLAAGQLQRLLTEAIPGSTQSVADVIESQLPALHRPRPAYDDAFTRLLACIEECRALNMANGAAIHVRRAHVSNALRLLFSQTEDASTYSPEQPVIQFQASRSLADA